MSKQEDVKKETRNVLNQMLKKDPRKKIQVDINAHKTTSEIAEASSKSQKEAIAEMLRALHEILYYETANLLVLRNRIRDSVIFTFHRGKCKESLGLSGR